MQTRTIVLIAVAVLVSLVAHAAADAPVVNTQSGPVRGVAGIGYNSFLGIPYAQPPVGNLRWADPQPARSWAPNVLDATTFLPGCPQVCDLPPLVCPNATAEDCLTLNVFAPSSVSTPVPVMVFFPGGRFEQGAAGVPLYDGAFFAGQTNTVLVTVDYRFGILGYMYTPALGGNFGVKDQVLALKWVQNNIAAFGGDPHQVTIFGESAGGTSVAVLLSSPPAQGLFHRAIIQSNPFALALKTTDTANYMAGLFANALGCDVTDAVCLRAKSADDVITAQSKVQNHIPPLHPLQMFLPWTPTVDGVWVVDQPISAMAAGQFARVPVMMGSVNDEAVMFVYSAVNASITHVEYDAAIVGIFHTAALHILSVYPFTPDTDGRNLTSRLGTDYMFLCPTRQMARTVAATHQPAFLYRFQHSFSFPQAWGDLYPFCWPDNVTCHGSELPFMFATSVSYSFTPAEQQLSRRMSTYWANFAHSGNPNYPLPVDVSWTALNDDPTAEMLFTAEGDSVEHNFRSSFCDDWDKWGYLF